MSKILSRTTIRNMFKIFCLAIIITSALSLGSASGADGFIARITGTTATKAATPPTVDTVAASAITVSAATLNGNLTSLGTATPVDVSFEYGTTDGYGSTVEGVPSTLASAAAFTALTSAESFTANLTGLTPGQTYHFRIKAVGDGTAYGDDATFTTDTPPGVILPEVTIKNASFTLTTFNITPLTSQTGDTVSISVTCANIGGLPGAYPIIFMIDGVSEHTEAISLRPGESQLITFAVTKSEPGTYEANVNGLTSSFVVEESHTLASATISDWPLFAGIGGGIIIVGLMILFILKPRMG